MQSFIGVAVTKVEKPISLLETKDAKGKVFIGVPFNGGSISVIEHIKDYLTENEFVKEENIIGNYMFIN